MTKKKTLPAKGTADIFGEDMRFRQTVIDTIRVVFERFGFEPLETPTIERRDTLTGKYGDEAQNLIFWVPDYEVGLRYDHTVPLARFVANNQGQLAMPYRRYAIGSVFRGENTQAGRLRQFTQCDFDTVGSRSETIDAEIVAMNFAVLTALGFTDQFSVNMNDRRLLNAMVAEMGFSDPSQATVIMTAWDKMDKVTPAEVYENYLVKQMSKFGVTEAVLSKSYVPVTTLLFDLRGERPEAILKGLSKRFKSETSVEALDGIRRLVAMVRAMDVPEAAFEFNPLLARGLSYYTGPIFETIVKEAGIGSITGGGRYDNLIEEMGGPSLAASGSSFGLERLLVVMEKLGIRPANSQTTKVFVTIFDLNDQDLVTASFRVATQLREAGIATEVYSGDGAKVGKQIALADRKGIPFIIVIGPDELTRGVANLRNLQTSEERQLSFGEIVGAIQTQEA